MAFGCAIGYGAQSAANKLITNQILKSKAGDARRVFKHLTVMTVVFCLVVMAFLQVTSQQVLHSMLSPVSSQIVGDQMNTKDREIIQGDGSALD
jgi:Na+-driven multidrug efflux pump